jgi:hypothetical protein
MLARVPAATWVAALALSAAPRVAEAAPVLRIEWPTVPGCPDSSVVLSRARQAIAGSKDVDDVRAVAEIMPPAEEGGSWQLHIRTRTVRGAGERTVDVPTCDAVARTAALLLAIASIRTRVTPSTERPIDELAPAPDRVEEPGTPTTPLAPLPFPMTPPDVARAASANAGDVHFVTSAGLGIAVGLLPTIAPAANARLGYEADWLSARVELRALLPQEAIDGEVGAELDVLGAGLDVCANLPVPAVLHAKTHACGGVAIDNVRARGIGGIAAFDVRRNAMMAFGGVGASWDIGRAFRIGADARVGGSFERPMFMIDSVPDGRRLLHSSALVRMESSLTFGTVF